MKYVDEFRRGDVARGLAARIAEAVQPGRHYRLMEFCGGHTHAIARYGLTGLLPAAVQLIHGPGCPVCVLPIGRIDSAIELALQHGAIVCTPDNPLGSCMVSSEGACAAHYTYGRFRDIPIVPAPAAPVAEETTP